MAEHTPGPWETVGGPGFATEIGANVGTADAVIVADTRLMPYDPTPRQLADARLIAAAPDLLAALYAAQAAFAPETIADPTFDPHGAVGRDEAVVTMLAAIAKAKGEAPRVG